MNLMAEEIEDLKNFTLSEMEEILDRRSKDLPISPASSAETCNTFNELLSE